MSWEKTLTIIKPDGLAKGLAGQILCLIKEHKLVVVGFVRAQLSRNMVERLYEEEAGEPYFLEIVDWVSSAPVLILMVEGEDAIRVLKRQIIGKYPNGLRGAYSENRIRNVAHAPDDEEGAERELRLLKHLFLRRIEMDERRFEGKKVFALTGMSECGKSATGKYLDSRGITRLKIVKLFERLRDKRSPGTDLQEFVGAEEASDPHALWDGFIDELMDEMESHGVTVASIESLYGGGMGPYLLERMGAHFCIVYIDATEEKRLQLQMIRQGLGSIEEAREFLLPRDEIKAASGIPQLKDIAGEVLSNMGSLEDLHRAIDEMVERHKP